MKIEIVKRNIIGDNKSIPRKERMSTCMGTIRGLEAVM